MITTTALDQKTNRESFTSQVNDWLLSRGYGAFVGLATGDALGATVEFMRPVEIQKQYGVHKNIIGGGWLKLKKGDVTDDTMMTFALADAILESGHIDATAIAQGFSDWMVRKPVDIGNTVRKGIIHFRLSGIPCSPESEHDAGNGACMRSLAIVLATLFASEEDAINASRQQAHITHHNSLSDAGTECVIKMMRDILNGADKSILYKQLVNGFLLKYPQFDFRGEKFEEPGGYIVETLQVVFQAFFNNDTLEDILVDAVNRGGDADTTGAIAGMLAGAYYGLENIPPRWLRSVSPDIVDQCLSHTDKLLGYSRSTYY